MRIPSQVKVLFRNYLERIFTPATLSEPNELAEYALYLIEQNEGPSLKQKCTEELTPFLENDNKSIIDRIFLMLEDLENLPIFEQKLLNELHILNQRARSSSPPEREDKSKFYKRYAHDGATNFQYAEGQPSWPQNGDRPYKDHRSGAKDYDKKYYRDPSKSMNYDNRRYERAGKDARYNMNGHAASSRQDQMGGGYRPHHVVELNSYRPSRQQLPKFPHDHHSLPRFASNSLPGTSRPANPDPANVGGGGPKETYGNSTVLDVIYLPKYINNIESLNAHFKQFGKIVNIETYLSENGARIKYETHQEAQNAVLSPLPVCNNRFVKVIWSSNKPAGNVAAVADNCEYYSHIDPHAFPLATTTTGCVEKYASNPADCGYSSLSSSSFYNNNRAFYRPKPMRAFAAPYFPRGGNVSYYSASHPDSFEQGCHLKANLAKADMDFQLLAQHKAQLKNPELSQTEREGLQEKCRILKDQLKTIISTNESLLASKKTATSVQAMGGNLRSGESPDVAPPTTAYERKKNNHWGHAGDSSRLSYQAKGARLGHAPGKFNERDHRSFSIDKRTTAFILKDIPSELQHADKLRTHFQKFGCVFQLALGGSDAHVQMGDRHSAEKAILQGTTIDGVTLPFEWDTAPVPADEPPHPESSKEYEPGIRIPAEPSNDNNSPGEEYHPE